MDLNVRRRHQRRDPLLEQLSTLTLKEFPGKAVPVKAVPVKAPPEKREVLLMCDKKFEVRRGQVR